MDPPSRQEFIQSVRDVMEAADAVSQSAAAFREKAAALIIDVAFGRVDVPNADWFDDDRA